MDRAAPLQPPPDSDLPRAGELLLPESAAVALGGFLDRRGFELQELRAVQAVYWPGRSCTVRYRARARRRDAKRWLSLCALTTSRPRSVIPPPEDFERRFGLPEPVERQGEDVLVWAYPYDPVLAGLPDAAHGPTVRAASGLPAPAAFSVTPLRYRPRKRAVLRYMVLGGGGVREVLYSKVLRDDAHRRTFDAHRALAGNGISLSRPRSFDGLDGVAVFSPLPGRSLRELLVDEAKLPSPRRVVELVHRVGAVPWRTGGAPRPQDRDVLSVGRLLAHLLPHRSNDIEDAAADLAERAGAVAPGPTVHGDLYEGQVFVGERNGMGLIDLDDAGPGDPLLDAANFLAHLSVLSASAPGARRRPIAYRALLRPLLLEGLGASEADLAWREALCMLKLATGPFRVLSARWPSRVEARVDAAIRLLNRGAIAA
ncbi:MAG: phosphotransferase [Actinomycetota bacterium]